MIEFINNIDIEVFLFLNGLHTPWMDTVMYYITNKYTWFPFYFLFVVLIGWRFKWKGLSAIIFVILAISFSDFITSGVMKPTIERLRPCHNPDLANLVHLVTGCGGKYGFASGHAANSFALATSVFLIFRIHYRHLGWLFLWAFIVAYSRIYVGVHYPFDIITGGIIGTILGFLLYSIYGYLPARLKIED